MYFLASCYNPKASKPIWYHLVRWINSSYHVVIPRDHESIEIQEAKNRLIELAGVRTTNDLYHLNELIGALFFLSNSDRLFVLRVVIDKLECVVETKIDPDKMQEIASAIEEMRVSLDNRIPEFGIQLQSIMGTLQSVPEAVWSLTDEQRKTIVDAFKQNLNVVCFQTTKGGSGKGHKIPSGPITPDMF